MNFNAAAFLFSVGLWTRGIPNPIPTEVDVVAQPQPKDREAGVIWWRTPWKSTPVPSATETHLLLSASMFHGTDKPNKHKCMQWRAMWLIMSDCAKPPFGSEDCYVAAYGLGLLEFKTFSTHPRLFPLPGPGIVASWY